MVVAKSDSTDASRKNHSLFTVLRIGVAVVALLFILSQVSRHDSVTTPDERVLAGKVLDDGSESGRVVIQTLDGGETSVARRWLAVPSESVGAPAHYEPLAPDEGADAENVVHAKISYGFYSIFQRANLWLILVAVVVFTPGSFLQGKRFQWMLRAQDIRVTFWESLKLCYIGNFLNFVFAIGATAGDFFKMYSLSRHTRRKTEAVITVLLDRVAGLIGLMVLVAILALFAPALRGFLWLTVIVLVAGAGGAILYMSPAVRRLVPENLIQKIPKLDHFRRIDRTAQNCVKHLPLTIGAVVATMFLQVFCIGSYVVAALALGFSIHSFGQLFEFYTYFGGGWFISSIPISVQGMGTVELFYNEMFKPYGSASQILCLAFAVRLVQLLSSLPGAAMLVTDGGHLPTREEMREIEQIEEGVYAPATGDPEPAEEIVPTTTR